MKERAGVTFAVVPIHFEGRDKARTAGRDHCGPKRASNLRLRSPSVKRPVWPSRLSRRSVVFARDLVRVERDGCCGGGARRPEAVNIESPGLPDAANLSGMNLLLPVRLPRPPEWG